MKRKILFQLFALGLFLTFGACQIPSSEAEELEENLSGGQWLAYSELQCNSNPWGYCNTNPDTKVCVKKYVQDQGYTVLEVTMIPAPNDLITCAACQCPTGRVFKVRVNEADVAKLEAVGFKKQ
ncbi:hypothetical protein [Rufibacter tibetensis]|uniref:Uncharacterized protein n=1 Tax=Rufibacter tibetensis TaxID=512763 RepID=A0A0P0C1Q2_9BACT|nr:hypothetical protein [Rufibacter tibetensis]ALI98858.1 hypothetical protein DC20_07565 [Rufibacter tibetensis]